MISWAHLQVEYYISIILAIGCDKLRPQEWSNQHTDDLKTELILQLNSQKVYQSLKPESSQGDCPLKQNINILHTI